MAVDAQSEGRNTLLVLAHFCPKCFEDVQVRITKMIQRVQVAHILEISIYQRTTRRLNQSGETVIL
jgi:hypothetical protein